MSTGRLGAGDTAIQPTILDAKGDLIVATAADTPARLAVGSANQVLTVDSSTATGLKWATAGGGGKVLQVITDTASTAVSSTNSTFVDTGLEITITPTANTSKIFIIATIDCRKLNNAPNGTIQFKLMRGATELTYSSDILYTGGNDYLYLTYPINYLDSPATTSATTYKLQFANNGGTNSGTVGVIYGGTTSEANMTIMEIGA